MNPAGRFGRALRFSAGACFAALLIFAPLYFGSTRAGGCEVITAICAASTLLWAASFAFNSRRPQVPAPVAYAAAFIALASLPWLTGLADATPVAAFTQTHFARVAARWPTALVWRAPEKGAIRYRRGIVDIVDRQTLQALSCECYGVVRDTYDRLLGA